MVILIKFESKTFNITMCIICNNQYDAQQELNITYCNNIKEIPIIPGLQKLSIYYCNSIKEIPHIFHCKNIIKIATIIGLRIIATSNHDTHITRLVKKNHTNKIILANTIEIDERECNICMG